MLHSDKRPSALIVDDELYARKLLHFVLKKVGIDCQQAESGDQALEIIDGGFIPQLILLDIMMPGRSGLETLAEIRRRPALAATSVVLLTGLVHEDVIRQAAKLGAKDYIRKPFHPEELAARMAKLLQAAS